MLICGIDPGLVNTGWGIISVKNNQEYVSSGLIQPDKKMSINDRIFTIFTQVHQIMMKYQIRVAAIEKIYVNDSYKSSLNLAYGRAASIIALKKADLFVAEYEAKKIKKTITGNGNATKEQVKYILQQSIVGLQQLHLSTLDVSDALAIASCHAFHCR